jgi:hypothetical protein
LLEIVGDEVIPGALIDVEDLIKRLQDIAAAAQGRRNLVVRRSGGSGD